MIRASDIITTFDVSGTIGRRYARGDEIGIPYAVTVDYDSIDDEKVTIRNRDNLKQKRVNISDVADIIKKLVNDEIEFDDI